MPVRRDGGAVISAPDVQHDGPHGLVEGVVARSVGKQPVEVAVELCQSVAEQVRSGPRQRVDRGHDVVPTALDGPTGDLQTLRSAEAGRAVDRTLVVALGTSGALSGPTIRAEICRDQSLD